MGRWRLECRHSSFSGDVVPPVSGEDEQLVTAEIDLADIQSAKLWLDGTGHYARPEILKLVVDDNQSLRSSILTTSAGRPKNTHLWPRHPPPGAWSVDTRQSKMGRVT